MSFFFFFKPKLASSIPGVGDTFISDDSRTFDIIGTLNNNANTERLFRIKSEKEAHNTKEKVFNFKRIRKFRS